MAQSASPRAVFSVAVTVEEYTAAARIASLGGGRLRTAWVGFVLLAALTLTIAASLAAYTLAAIGLLLGGGVIALTALCLMQYAFGRTVARNYTVFSATFPTAEVVLWEDMLEYNGAYCRRNEAYALFSRLVESRTLFVLQREDGTFLVIPKRALATTDNAADFLRLTFARKYRKTRG
ncbi:MAG: YcxB family protein [Ruminococcaceae bacterium]|nr:YcxB family protein [Oscillospiraceae bacterium]